MKLSKTMPQALAVTAAIVAWVCVAIAIILAAATSYGGNVSLDVWEGVARREKIGIVFRADGEDYLLAFRDTQAADEAKVAEAVRTAPKRCRVTGAARHSETYGLTIRVDKIEVLK